jgi:uncharacterized protein YidB (DUF937 family)
MSLLSTILAFASGVVAGPAAEKLVHKAMDMLNDPQTGGLSGLVESFRKQGLGDLVSSWIGTGENRQVSAEQVQQALGEAKVQQGGAVHRDLQPGGILGACGATAPAHRQADARWQAP